MKFYLGGPIANVSRAKAGQWRAEARRKLEAIGHSVNDPNERLCRPGIEKEIIESDLEEIRKSDILIAHTPTDVFFHGTSMEIFFAAYVLRIPVFTFPVNPTPWLIHWSEQFEDLASVLDHVRSLNGTPELLSTST